MSVPIPRPERERRRAISLTWIVAAIIGIIVAAWIFFSFENIGTWMAFNDPFQSQWATVQLTDGEVIYGHLAGVSGDTIGLTDVYLLDKVNEESSSTASSTDFSLGGTAGPQVGQALVPVNYTQELYIQRTAVLYFKFVAPGDPALPYLR